MGLPWWLSGKESVCQSMRHTFDPWVGKTPSRRKWQPTPGFLPGESHGQRSLAGYSPWGRKESDCAHIYANTGKAQQTEQKLPSSFLKILRLLNFLNIYFNFFGCTRPQSQCVGLSVVACKLLTVSCGIQFPDQGMNLGPLHCKRRLLATGPPGKSLPCPLITEIYLPGKRWE